MSPFVITERLRLREFRPADLEHLYRLDSDPRVMRYIGDGSVLTRASVAEALARVTKYYRNYPGLGVWSAEERDGHAFIGWFCLKYVPKTVEVEVGYRLLPDAWGRGYATEGLTHPDNLASQRVLAKAGLRDAGWGRYYGRDLRLFAASRGESVE